MNFFEHQSKARNQIGLLVLGFVLAVLLFIALIDALAWAILRFFHQAPADPLSWLATPTAWYITGTVGVIILGVSAYRALDLRYGGGYRVARSVGARFLDPFTVEGDERTLINVVEEMSIAAGLPPPDVLILESETSINAFAAGNHPANAAITVTRGLLEKLDRAALQAIIAHEFSHILNGDMRLNIRLLALLSGLTFIFGIGATPWRWVVEWHREVTEDKNNDKNEMDSGSIIIENSVQAFLRSVSSLIESASLSLARGVSSLIVFAYLSPLLVIGSVLALVGWIGVFTARVIKAGISRQREYLADAAAVQLTRNADGLATALATIYADEDDSRLRMPRAEQISHMAFARSVGAITRITGTHPTIEQRIAALGPQYELWFRRDCARKRRRRAGYDAPPNAPDTAPGAGSSAGSSAGGPAPSAALTDAVTHPASQLGDVDGLSTALSGAALAALAGTTDALSVDHGHNLLQKLPDAVRKAMRTPNGAVDTVFSLLLHRDDERERDLAALPEQRHETVIQLRERLVEACPGTDDGTLDPAIRLPIVELCLRSLRRLDDALRTELLGCCDQLIRADGRLSVFEYATRTLLRHALDPARKAPRGNLQLQRQQAPVAVVISLLAHAGDMNPDERERAYNEAMAPLFGERAEPLLERGECGLRAFSAALEQLAGLQPLGKRALLVACGDCIAADGRIRAQEAELLRTIAAVLDTPVPPVATLER